MVIDEIPQADMSATETHVHVILEGLAPGRALAFRETPLGISKTDSVVAAVTSAFDGVMRLDQVIASARGSEESPTPPLTIRATCSAAHLRAVAALARGRDAVSKAQAALQAAEDRFYLPTPRAADDVVGFLLDSELRQRWNPSDEKLMDSVTQGQSDQLLDAMARFPVGADAQLAKNIRRGLVSVASPETVRGFARAKERVVWGQTVLGLIEGALLAGAAMTGPSPLMDEEPATVH